MDQPSLYERIGGLAGVEAVVRTLHLRVQGDPNTAPLMDEMRAADIADADVRELARVLDARDVGRPAGGAPACSGVLYSRREISTRHLRDALWMLGISSALVDEVTEAVVASNVVQRDAALRQP